LRTSEVGQNCIFMAQVKLRFMNPEPLKKFMCTWWLTFWVLLSVMGRACCFKSPSDIRYVARVAYDGTSFRGFQAQRLGIPTVQTTVLDALRMKLGPYTTIAGASRTDVGVHARGNCIHFDVPVHKLGIVADSAKFEYQLNSIMPETVRLFDLRTAPAGKIEEFELSKPFHATSSSIGKRYSYSFCTNTIVDPLKRRHFAHYRGKLDQELLQLCLTHFIGTHDFVSFANNIPNTRLFYESVGQKLDTTRSIDSAELREIDDGYFQIDFRIRSALYQMIRNIVGTSICVAQGKMPLSRLQELLEHAPGREHNPAKSAPPEGLVLEHVHYDNY